MAQMQVFVSHSSRDKAFCDQLVAALRGAGADVWYDEHNLGAGVLRREITQQLAQRPVVIVIVSKAALTSQWVQDECEWAYNLARRKPDRLILPVVAAPYDPDDFDHLLFIESLKRIEGPANTPLPAAEAVARTLRLLELTPAGQRPTPVAPPQPSESLDDLLTKGKALSAQGRHAEAIPFLERATKVDPRSFDAWGNLGALYGGVGRWQDALTACDRALALDEKQAWVWTNKGAILNDLGRYQEALVAYDRALALDPNYRDAWSNKGAILNDLGRYQEAIAALDRALALDPNDALAWYNKGNAFNDLKRHQEALASFDRALALDPNYRNAWYNKGTALWELKRYADAVAACDKALSIDPKFRIAWTNKAIMLRALGRTKEAEEAERRAKALGG